MATIITNIEFVIDRGQPLDPATGVSAYRNPLLKNRVFKPFSETSGYLANDKFNVVNDTIGDVYGFDLTGGRLFANGEKWFVSVFPSNVVADVYNYTIIDPSYFIRNIYIPNANNQVETINKVTEFIKIHEPELLQKLLGYPLFKKFIADITGPTPQQKYVDLLFGVEYTNRAGQLQKWMGFMNPQKLSIIANYVYFNYMTDANTTTTAAGESKQKSEGGFRTDAAQKASRAWNEMRSWIDQLGSYLDSKPTDFPDWQLHDFPFCSFGNVNQFGI